MLAFECDYLEGAHEKILNRLIETNMEKLPGYGADPYCASAREKILDACQCPEGEVFFLVGGTRPTPQSSTGFYPLMREWFPQRQAM